ncbi:MAG: hypothetical protein ACLFP2_03685 [Candidatus Woesearchaeota archaeon]
MIERLIIAREGARMAKRSIQVRIKGFSRYQGNAKEICREIIKDCFNQRYFQVSNGHFKSFYIRDFSWCIQPLLDLGFEKEVYSTLEYCLSCYERHNRVSVAISDVPFDFPRFAVDSLPSLIHCLKVADARSLLEKHKEFLIDQLNHYYRQVIDKSNGMVKKGHFSSIKDHYIRNSCCYDNTMVAMLSKDLNELSFYNPVREFRYEKLLVFTFWNGEYFRDEERSDIISGDANIFPFWSGVITDKKMLHSALKTLQKEGLESPYPLAYTKRDAGNKIKASILAPGYEDDSLWMHIGSLFLQLIKEVSRKDFNTYLKRYTTLIEEHQTFLEVLDKEGKPFKRLFYITDEAMLWASIYLSLCEN